jgi:hypothetical protein
MMKYSAACLLFLTILFSCGNSEKKKALEQLADSLSINDNPVQMIVKLND